MRSVQNVGMVVPLMTLGQDSGGPWVGSIYEHPYTVPVAKKSFLPQVNCSGTPTSSFAVVNGVVTHC
jgi:hypothetical protein